MKVHIKNDNFTRIVSVYLFGDVRECWKEVSHHHKASCWIDVRSVLTTGVATRASGAFVKVLVHSRFAVIVFPSEKLLSQRFLLRGVLECPVCGCP